MWEGTWSASGRFGGTILTGSFFTLTQPQVGHLVIRGICGSLHIVNEINRHVTSQAFLVDFDCRKQEVSLTYQAELICTWVWTLCAVIDGEQAGAMLSA